MQYDGGSELLTLGGILLAGYGAHTLGRRVRIPRVTLLLLLGVVCAPGATGIVPEEVARWFPFVSHAALAMVGFLIGESLARTRLHERGRVVLVTSLVVLLVTAAAVLLATLACGAALPLALLLAGIAPATAPAATLDVVRESGAEGPLTETLLGVVAIDDAWGAIGFSVLLAIAAATLGRTAAGEAVLDGVLHLAGAVGLGLALGLPAAWLTGRGTGNEPTLAEAMGFVFLCGGLASVLGVSYLVACMTMGITVAKLARHHARGFHEIEGVSDPFLILFFFVAGFELELGTLAELGTIGTAYLAARGAGKVIGGSLGGRIARAPRTVTTNLGWCLLPQAGISVGLALLAREAVPEVGDAVLSLIIATTVLFELAGPPLTWWRLARAGETRAS